ncbi:mannose/fructose/N-acetylgalactosamine-specific phosphotransferase system component IIB [Breznakia sp. PF5-3]|uniref:PTS system mannose/fructose/N-acetylgalactosamine-transporter subunit IIB n=1 Tax=unclassified Breznakia TaxID=2623764 RepID=UPI002404F619|nr:MULTISPECIES: PTS sugar transporter subunit IIB [unclassified Breznakia]MDF9824748.1 mannose/fructose/N-acetylgalactosamine-specific phosphotransferase system component IIB [Breznakia sp. PM6-1]MDF9835685.1 mannose/fructose/N-acetylgalactosamine-specific phosphotransferase system component IIB [Breznakia sp. PF5-3]MDF9837734.1 mannose/fructose/N-acetylgalactosamine-specific phosphotransferase system component IIB [Breznakia sp. PFB2-8]MDF9859695.1 mannose/fructose/N-acetylgalactosamine-speci
MNIKVFRIDDRLIHGQIVTAWIAQAEAKQIVVIDDLAAKDTLQQSLLQMATPKNINLKILNVADGIAFLKSDEGNDNTLLLVRGPKQALMIIDECTGVESINVGNINMKKGKKKILDNVWVDEDEVKDLKELGTKVEVEVRAVPNDHKQNLIDLL